MIRIIALTLCAFGCAQSKKDMIGACQNNYNTETLSRGIVRLFSSHSVLPRGSLEEISTEPMILKFYELLLHHMILRQIITLEQGQEIVQKAKTSGGELIGGHNVLMLGVSTLEAGYNDGWYGKREAQAVIDAAKCNTVEITGGLPNGESQAKAKQQTAKTKAKAAYDD